MKIDRRTLLGGIAATLAAPLPSFAASITDATGRTIIAPDRVQRVYPAGPPAGGRDLYARARSARRMARTDPARRARVPASRDRRAAGNSAAHRTWRRQDQSRGAEIVQARPDRRYRRRQRQLQIARRARAAGKRPSLCVDRRPSRQDGGIVPHARSTARPHRRRREACPHHRRHDRRSHVAGRLRPERRPPARLLCARPYRTGHRASGLDGDRADRAFSAPAMSPAKSAAARR